MRTKMDAGRNLTRENAGHGELDRLSGGENIVTFGSLVMELARFAFDFQRNPTGRGGIRV